jgi:alpha-galactosidase
VHTLHSNYRDRLLLAALAATLVVACGREDIELSPPQGSEAGGNGAMVSDDCSASVPGGLLAPRPPLGWNGYNTFGCSAELNEAKVKANIDALVDSGMLAAGYQYVNLDQCWQQPRSETKTRVFDPERLPGGVAGLAQLVHDRGLLLGVFAPIGDCLGEPGGDGFEALDAQGYADWGVDYLKYVACPSQPTEQSAVVRMERALRDTGRPIVLSVAGPPFAEWMPRVAQLWRTSGNVAARWESIVESIDSTTPLAAYTRPGAFNDPDMLEIGRQALSEGEERVQFAVWSILSAPLLAGNDLTTMDEVTLATLTNADIIALDQDPLGLQGALVRRDGDVDVLAKPLAGCGARGVVLWNRGQRVSKVTLSWPELWLGVGPASVQELWSHVDLPADPEGVTLTIAPHDAVALRITGVEPALPRGDVNLSELGWTYAVNGSGPVELDTSNGEDQAADGGPMRLRGAAYDKGVGVHAPSLIRYRLGQKCSRFVADVGIDDETSGSGSAEFEIWADGLKLYGSGVVTGRTPSKRVDIDVSGRRELRLFVSTGGDDYRYDHADWAGARLLCDTSP